ncbi:MAG TPA: hypothetical protein VEY30_05090, partial [Myxococcaceae bacterium]|nr:hypothetical protein [Myxococcaceae bacterium]
MSITDLAAAPNGDIYALAYSIDTPTGSVVRDLVMRYEPNTLEARWTQLYQSGTKVLFSSLAVDEFNRSYLGGGFEGSMTFGSTTLTASGSEESGLILALNVDGSTRWAKKAGVEGYLTDISTREGHLVAAAKGKPEGSQESGGYLLSFDLSGKSRFQIRTGVERPWDIQLSPFKQVAVLTPADDFDTHAGYTSDPFFISLYDRVTGA